MLYDIEDCTPCLLVKHGLVPVENINSKCFKCYSYNPGMNEVEAKQAVA